ncbi:hypothetical protein E2C01_102143 [Portunus trituberculatus]|uniref:Uncharacterized protein n=1 Tax=Portunus trituberculatus TaxID=210409 RepID=A0A5B7KHS5_PORTR|nr:hypothetical protein [Portunus trituberculatus]
MIHSPQNTQRSSQRAQWRGS